MPGDSFGTFRGRSWRDAARGRGHRTRAGADTNRAGLKQWCMDRWILQVFQGYWICKLSVCMGGLGCNRLGRCSVLPLVSGAWTDGYFRYFRVIGSASLVCVWVVWGATDLVVAVS